MEPSPLVTPEDVLESLMNDGTIDSIRLKIINQLKANEELKSTTIKMAEQSKVLNTPGAEKQTKRELFDSLRQELEMPVLEKASKSVWELILDENGLGKEISEEVEKVFCRLSGQEPPLFYPYPESLAELQNEKQSSVENKGKEKLKEKESSESTTKRRKHVEVNSEVGGKSKEKENEKEPSESAKRKKKYVEVDSEVVGKLKEKENEKEPSESAKKKKKYVEVDSEVGGKSKEKDNEKEPSESAKKKRKHRESSSELARADEGTTRSNVTTDWIEDSGKSHLPSN